MIDTDNKSRNDPSIVLFLSYYHRHVVKLLVPLLYLFYNPITIAMRLLLTVESYRNENKIEYKIILDLYTPTRNGRDNTIRYMQEMS